MKKIIGVYIVSDLQGNYYVGSSGDINNRLYHHKIGNNHFNKKMYLIELTRKITLKRARKLENKTIKELNYLGFTLLNKYLIK
jgi:predicted GIY-YIG superfamily endonuclease